MIRDTIAAIAVSLALAAPLAAGETRTREIEALTEADQKLAQAEKDAARDCSTRQQAFPGKAQQNMFLHCRSVATSHRQKAQRQRLEVQELLNQLEAGSSVDPAAVDRILREAEQQY